MAYTAVFVVSDDVTVRDSVSELAESAGLRAETFPALRVFLDAVQPGRWGCLVLDAQVGNPSDPERQEHFAAACARMPCLLMVDRGDVPMAVRGQKAGAMCVVQKPFRDKNLLDRIKDAVTADAAAHSRAPNQIRT